MSDASDFQNTPSGWAQRWQTEFSAARKELEKWHQQGVDINKRFRDERDSVEHSATRWNLFTSNVQTQRALLYGRTPTVSVGRRFADAADDTARVAGELLERMLNADIERDSDSYQLALQYALDDRLLAGCGSVRLRYVAEFEEVPEQPAQINPLTGMPDPATYVPAHERKVYEDVETDYVHWKDQMWSAGTKVFHEARWWSFRALMSREQLIERFGEEIGRQIPLNAKRHGNDTDEKKDDPWGRSEVWEIWDKEHKTVFWYVDGFPTILDHKPDPLGLDGFWPFPRPMMANLTTSALIPRPDFVIAQDLYNEIDSISTRITVLEQAVRVAGVYDSTADGVKALLSPNARGNTLSPVDNWNSFAEKGGLRGAVDWLPLEPIIGAIATLRQTRQELIDALYQITGMSDIMRGQATAGGVTATEQGIKARFGSVRVQALQDDFARFASDAQKIKAEIIAKHFDPETIAQRANSQMGFDAQVVPQAIQLIKSDLRCYRVEVKPEAVSMTDFAALKQERSEVVASIAQFMTSAAPIAQGMPNSLPFLLQILQWMVSGLRGASQIEGVLDQAIQAAQEAAKQPQQPQQPDPKLLVQQMKSQAEMAKLQAETQAELVKMNAEVQADDMRERNQMNWNVREALAKSQISNAQRALSPAANINRGLP